VGVDRSESLIEQARARCSEATFAAQDLLDWRPTRAVAAVLCRGVLNDLLTDGERAGAFAAFGSWLAAAGCLVADVREWDATRRRYTSAPLYVRTVARGQDELTFSSETTLDPAHRLMLVHERYTGVVAGAQVEDAHDFTMRCWTSGEAHDHATAAGFATVELEAGPTADRLLILAER
jgi:trans-aconitate methyltransferase